MKKYLLIDDEEIFNFIQSEVIHLHNQNNEVVMYSSAHEALVYLKELIDQSVALPDFILLDIRMPNMGGVEMCTEMKKRSKSIPFLFLTAVTDDYKILYAMMSGADQIVDKPIKLDYLTSVVNGMLEDV